MGLKELLAQLAAKKAEAKALESNPAATAEAMNAIAAEIKVLNKKVEEKNAEEGDDGDGDEQDKCEDEAKDEKDEATKKKNVANLLNLYPNLVNRIINEAKAGERQRMQEIDNIASQVSPELVKKAKYTNIMSAKDLAFEQMKASKEMGGAYLNAFFKDTADGNQVGADPEAIEDGTPEKQTAVLGNSIANYANKIIGR